MVNVQRSDNVIKTYQVIAGATTGRIDSKLDKRKRLGALQDDPLIDPS